MTMLVVDCCCRKY